jgi:hypothetical protein
MNSKLFFLRKGPRPHEYNTTIYIVGPHYVWYRLISLMPTSIETLTFFHTLIAMNSKLARVLAGAYYFVLPTKRHGC